jgi:hypothetical protein
MKSLIAVLMTLFVTSAQALVWTEPQPIKGGFAETLQLSGQPIIAETAVIYLELLQNPILPHVRGASYRLLLRLNENEILLPVFGAKKGDCGSTVYTAKFTEPGADTYSYNLSLVDHSTRLCEDYRPYMWEATLTINGGFGGFTQKVNFALNPEPFFTIQ